MEKKTLIQFIKFVIIGIVNTGVDWLAFFLLRLIPFFAVFEVWAKAIAFVIAATNSFIWNSIWTFREEFDQGIQKSQSKLAKGSGYYMKFMLVSVVGFFLNVLVFKLARDYLFVGDSNWLRVFSLALASFIVTIWNFSANKWWTYR